MQFGDTVREILTTTCGADLREARPHCEVPGLESPQVRWALAANLRLAFDIALTEDDLERLHTVRDVLQCVRLRRWQRRAAAAAGEEAAPPAEAVTPSRVATETPAARRFVRYTPRPAVPATVLTGAPAATKRY